MMGRVLRAGLVLGWVVSAGMPAGLPAQGTAGDAMYRVYVAAESEDEVAVLRFSPDSGLEVERRIPVGQWPAEIEGPHGIFFDPAGDYWYLTLGHGFPNGSLLQFDAAADTVVGWSELGMFPATVSLTGEGALAFTVNSNFYGDHVPSTVSVVDTELMLELAQVETCTMPHGSRMGVDGRTHYSACMMDEQLVEMSTESLQVTRRLDLITGEPVSQDMSVDAGHAGHAGMDMAASMADAEDGVVCSPTWTTPHPDGRRLYVACNRGHEIVEVDLQTWSVERRFPAEGAPYNLALSPEGDRLFATLKGSAHIAVWDLESGAQRAKTQTGQRVTHGVVITHDGRFAFVTVEGIGGEPGLVEVYDADTLERLDVAEIGKQAGGIALVPTGTGR